jgi:hypothetical protein
MHPWYNELIRIVFGNSLRKQVSESEHVLLNRVRTLIGDDVQLDKFEFVRLMKLIPNHDFMREEIQRIFKFLRLQLGISELDYFDAIESSGQMLAGNVSANN